MITKADVHRRVEAMSELLSAQAWGTAAQYERALWKEVLTQIAEGGYDAQDLAAAAIRTCEYKFPRGRKA